MAGFSKAMQKVSTAGMNMGGLGPSSNSLSGGKPKNGGPKKPMSKGKKFVKALSGLSKLSSFSGGGE